MIIRGLGYERMNVGALIRDSTPSISYGTPAFGLVWSYIYQVSADYCGLYDCVALDS